MDAGLLVNIISVLAASASAIYARGSNVKAEAAQRTSDAALLNQVLVQMLFEYRSAEMLSALRSLKDLWRAKEHNLTQAYEAKRIEDAKKIDELPPTQRLDYERTTLHYQRRFVSQFYGILAGLYEQK